MRFSFSVLLTIILVSLFSMTSPFSFTESPKVILHGVYGNGDDEGDDGEGRGDEGDYGEARGDDDGEGRGGDDGEGRGGDDGEDEVVKATMMMTMTNMTQDLSDLMMTIVI